MIHHRVFSLLSYLALFVLAQGMLLAQTRPNILIIYTDDQGYGDVSALNPEARFQTPHIDRLVREGLTFTDGHSSDTVCTPSRYGLLTGRYSWRTWLKRGVLGAEGPCLIENGRVTLASLLRDHGYQTAMVGKWHLGMKFAGEKGRNRDWSQPFTDGPIEKGFDRFFGIPASINYGILTYLDQDHVTTPPTLWTRKKPGLVVHDRASYRIKPPYDTERDGNNLEVAPDFVDEDVLKVFTEKAVAWIRQAAAQPRPFFLYLAYTSPHKPVAPRKEFRGRSRCGAYGDFMIETDHRVGQLLALLDELGIADNTMVVFTSDNGPENTWKGRIEMYGHRSAGIYRGGKRSRYEGGHRLPFIIRWPKVIQAGTTYDGPVCQIDLLATFADMLGTTLPPNAGEDSFSFYPVLTGGRIQRPALIHHSAAGEFAIREGDWKLILNKPRTAEPSKSTASGTSTSSPPTDELYNLREDPSETTNLADQHPDRVRHLARRLKQLTSAARSVPLPGI